MFLYHGALDDDVPIERAQRSYDHIFEIYEGTELLKFTVDAEEGHSFGSEILKELKLWLENHI